MHCAQDTHGAADSGARDQHAVARMVARDRSGLEWLYDQHAAVMLRCAMRILNNRSDAQDLIHDVFLEAWRKADGYDRRRASVRSWLLLRVRSRSIDRVRALQTARRHAMLENSADDFGVDKRPGPEKATEGVIIRRAMRTLSDAQQLVFRLGYFEGLTCREIAQRCGIPVGTVKSRLSAGVVKLRSQLGTREETAL